jgi:hypothetical protein
MGTTIYYVISLLLFLTCVAAGVSAWRARKRYLAAKARNDSLLSCLLAQRE